jgi:nitric oxide reductase large subunit
MKPATLLARLQWRSWLLRLTDPQTRRPTRRRPTVILRIVKALLLGIAATMACMLMTPPTESFDLSTMYPWWCVGVGALVTLALALPR